jgi:hypothetical protein
MDIAVCIRWEPVWTAASNPTTFVTFRGFSIEMASIHLSPLMISPTSGLRRTSPRPPHLRQADYEDAFDWLTIFYDCFRAPDPRWIGLLGPPLGELASTVLSALRPAMPGAGTPFVLRDLDRHAQIWIPTSETTVLIEGGPFEPATLAVQPSGCDLFRDKRVLLTKSKDNDLNWIKDWACFHARLHGTNAVLLYDNASGRYSSDEIREVLRGVKGLEIAVVVDWPYKFGPQGFEGVWDSDFCEYGMMEHARHRFLALAEGVINADIDELVYTEDGSSVYQRMKASPEGFVLYPGLWVENIRARSSDPGRRHRDFTCVGGNSDTGPKWTVAPRRCPVAAQWRTHHISGMNADRESSRGISYWHFRGINTNWKELRWQDEVAGPEHAPDRKLARAMKVFDRD